MLRIALGTLLLGGTLLVGGTLGVGCGGKAVIDGDAGNGGAQASGATTVVSSSTGQGPCQSHDDCDAGKFCRFADGQCYDPCPLDSGPCPVGLICEGCGTSSCPQCLDCIAICVPAAPGQCDDHDDCLDGDVCLYGAGQCAPPCVEGLCEDFSTTCNDCATSSCPTCKDCVAACEGSF